VIRYLSKRTVYAFSLLLFLLFLGYSLPSFRDLRNTLVREYFDHKEFLFNLKNAPRIKRNLARERDVREILSKLGVEPEKIVRTESGLELNIHELGWEKVPYLIKELESRYEILSFSAVDNTGKGVFDIRIVIR